MERVTSGRFAGNSACWFAQRRLAARTSSSQRRDGLVHTQRHNQ